MPPFIDIVLLLLLPVLLAASGFFSGSETALFSLSTHERMELSRSSALVGRTISTLLSETRALLITLLLGNMVVNVMYFVISTVLLLRLKSVHGAQGLVVAVFSTVPLLALILAGEVWPKMVAARMHHAWSRLVSVPLLVMHRALGPIRAVVNALVITPLARLIAPRHRPAALSSEELERLLESSQKRGIIDRHEEEMLSQVLELSQLKVRDLMTPRVDVRAFDLDESPQHLLELTRATRLRQIPVYREDLDHIEGVVYSKQVLLTRPKTTADVRELIREALFVPELQRAEQLLVMLRQSTTTMAVVVDEYGGTAGLITVEDVVEQMVGQIAGPFESDDGPQVEWLGPGAWRTSANLPIRDWAETFAVTGTAIGAGGTLSGLSTMGGLVMARLGRVPRVGDQVAFGNVLIEVESMQGRRVSSLAIRLVDRHEPGSEGRRS